jgi:hypothetical protein
MLKKFEFGTEAVSYIQSSLFDGDTLSRHLLSLPLKNGQVTAHLPATVSSEMAQRFEVGGITTRNNTVPHLVAFITTYLSGRGKPCAVFEAIERHGDLYLSLSKQPFFVHNSEIYYFLGSQNRDSEKVRTVIQAARSYPFIGVLTSLSESDPDIRVAQEVTESVLRKLAARTKHLLIGAYDAEGILVWSRS